MANNAVCANRLAHAHCKPEMTARDVMGMVMGFQQTQVRLAAVQRLKGFKMKLTNLRLIRFQIRF